MADLVCDGAANQTIPNGVADDGASFTASQSKQASITPLSGDNFTPTLPPFFPSANAASLDQTAARFGEALPLSQTQTITARIQTASIVSIPYNSRKHDSSNPKGIGHYHWFTIQIPEVGELKVRIGVVALKSGTAIEVLEASIRLDKGKEIVFTAGQIEIKKNVISFTLPAHRSLRITWEHQKRTSIPPHLSPEVQIESFSSFQSKGPKILNREFSSAPQISLIPTRESLLAFEHALLRRNQCVPLELHFNGSIGNFSFTEPLKITGTIDASGKFQVIGSSPFAVSVVDTTPGEQKVQIAHFKLEAASLSFPYSRDKDKLVLLSPVSLLPGDSLFGYVYPASSSTRLTKVLSDLRYVTFPAFGGNIFRAHRPLALDKEDLMLIFSYPPSGSGSSLPEDGVKVELLSPTGKLLQQGRFCSASDDRWVFQLEGGEEKVLSFKGTADGTNLRVEIDQLASEIRPVEVPFVEISSAVEKSLLKPSFSGSLQLLRINNQLRFFELTVGNQTLELQVAVSLTCEESAWSYKPFKGFVDGKRLKRFELFSDKTKGLLIVLPNDRQWVIPFEYLAAAERAAPGLIARDEIPNGPSNFQGVPLLAASDVDRQRIAPYAFEIRQGRAIQPMSQGDRLVIQLSEGGAIGKVMARSLGSMVDQLVLLDPSYNNLEATPANADSRGADPSSSKEGERPLDLAQAFAQALELNFNSPTLGNDIYKKLKTLVVNGYSQFQPLKDCLEIVIRASERNRDLRPYINDLLLHAVREWFVPQASAQNIQEEADQQAHRFVSGYLTRKQLSEERIELLKGLVRKVSRKINENKEEAQKEQRKKKERSL